MIREIFRCRLCCSSKLKPVLNLGEMALTGYFPKKPDKKLLKAPLELVQCKKCELVQLRHSVTSDILWGDHYGYQSNLNASMVKHIEGIVAEIKKRVKLNKDDIVLDIGSNDATLLKSYKTPCTKIGIDPISKFSSFYGEEIIFVNDFFPSLYLDRILTKQVKVITSIAMFYDVDSPFTLAYRIQDMLGKGGIWVTEQSYLPRMLENNSYDTICHEHKCYYDIPQMEFIAEAAELKIIDINYNEINGGSFRVTFQKI